MIAGFLVVRVGNAQYGTAGRWGGFSWWCALATRNTGRHGRRGVFLVVKIWDWGGGVKGKKI